MKRKNALTGGITVHSYTSNILYSPLADRPPVVDTSRHIRRRNSSVSFPPRTISVGYAENGHCESTLAVNWGAVAAQY